MSEESAVGNLIRGIRSGEEQAAVAFVRQYETLVRRQVRWLMTDPELFRLFDPEDVCQRPVQRARACTGPTRGSARNLDDRAMDQSSG